MGLSTEMSVCKNVLTFNALRLGMSCQPSMKGFGFNYGFLMGKKQTQMFPCAES